jgi:uncharacterized membrane protein
MKQHRFEGLADGIFAIVMTILVFEIRVPEYTGMVTDRELLGYIIKIFPLFLSYLLSFSLLFTYWRAHHYITSVLAKNFDNKLSNLNALFFFFVGLVPFSSRLLGTYSYTETAIVVFATNIICIGLALYSMRQHVIKSDEIKNTPFTKIENAHANVRLLLPVVIAIIAIGVSFVHKNIALSFFTIAILFNLSSRSTRYMFSLVNMFYQK